MAVEREDLLFHGIIYEIQTMFFMEKIKKIVFFFFPVTHFYLADVILW